jgi:ribose transport system ATP-binding protein
MSSEHVALAVEGLSKSFDGVRVLDDVGFSVAQGEIHGLIGRNGSGKSTLIKILSGYHAPDPGGSIHVRGEEISLPVDVGEIHRRGLAFVHQDLGLAPTMSVLENVRVGRFATGFGRRVSWRSERRIVRRELDRFELDVSPDDKTGDLSMIDRSLVAIVRAFSLLEDHEGAALILDEPTASLPRDGVERLFAGVRQAAQQGAGVVFVSHRLEEIRTLTDRLTVLRDGRVAGTLVTAEVSEAQIIEMILGHALSDEAIPEHAMTSEVVLSARGLSGETAHDVTFDLHHGEVLGLTGLIGMGHEEIPYLLFGARPGDGEIRIGGEELDVGDLSPARAMAAGVALLPADRQRSSGAGNLSVRDNVSLPVIDSFFTGAFLHPRREHNHVASLLHAYDVRPPLPQRKLQTLSGGNQQKALLAKWLQTEPAIVILHEPTQGVDVSARDAISRYVAQIAADGRAVVLCSSDSEDLARLCQRVLVFRDGKIVSEIVGDVTEDRIVEHCYAT